MMSSHNFSENNSFDHNSDRIHNKCIGKRSNTNYIPRFNNNKNNNSNNNNNYNRNLHGEKNNVFHDGYNYLESDFDYAKDRKQRRKAARAAQKQARIEAHERWVGRCRANRNKSLETKAKHSAVSSSSARPLIKKKRISSKEQREKMKIHDNYFRSNNDNNEEWEHKQPLDQSLESIQKFNNDLRARKTKRKREEKDIVINIENNNDNNIKSDIAKEKFVAEKDKKCTAMEKIKRQCVEAVKEEPTTETTQYQWQQQKKLECFANEFHQENKNTGVVVTSSTANKSNTNIPAVINEQVRRCVNKLTLSNLIHIIHEICSLFGDHIDCGVDLNEMENKTNLPITNKKRNNNRKREGEEQEEQHLFLEELNSKECINAKDCYNENKTSLYEMKGMELTTRKRSSRKGVDDKLIVYNNSINNGKEYDKQTTHTNNQPRASRAIVMASLAEQLIKFCSIDTGVLTPINTLPIAGVVRGLQIMYGNMVGGELIEKLAYALEQFLFDGNESAANNVGMIFAQLYLIYSVDATFIISLLEFLTLSRYFEINVSSSNSNSANNVVKCDNNNTHSTNMNEIHANALSCAVAVLRVCSEKLVKEAANGLECILQQVRHRHTAWCERVISKSIKHEASVNDHVNKNQICMMTEKATEQEEEEQHAQGISEKYATFEEDHVTLPHKQHESTSTQHYQNRCAAQISIMSEIASGYTRQHRKRNNTESDWSIDELLQQLCTLLPGAQQVMKKTKKNQDTFDANPLRKSDHLRSLRRMVQVMHTLSNISFTAVLRKSKPAQWYEPGVLLPEEEEEFEEEEELLEISGKNKFTDNGDSKGNLSSAEAGNKKVTDTTLRNVNGTAASTTSLATQVETTLPPPSTSTLPFSRKEQIHQLRTEERAIAGQRFNTEFKREVFKCVINASDDLDCFNALTARDPSHNRFADICAVLIQCCYQEETYNVYYANILSRFLSIKPAFSKTFQFALWDKFKSIRIGEVDVAGYLNLACLITAFMERGTFTLSVLRGLDLNDVNRTVGLFTRMTLLRMIMELSSSRLTSIFFGGDGLHAHDVQINTSDFRRCLTTFINHYFIDESVAARWLPLFYDVVAVNTNFAKQQLRIEPHTVNPSETINNGDVDDDDNNLRLFMKRVQVAYKALKSGISEEHEQ